LAHRNGFGLFGSHVNFWDSLRQDFREVIDDMQDIPMQQVNQLFLLKAL
jgi:hypothetical protein